MAIDKEFLATHFQGVENADEHISAILAENFPLTRNRDDILGEKKAIEKKLAELQEKHDVLETANKELNEKLESGLPDKDKQFFKEEIKKLEGTILKLTDDSNKMKTEYEEKINGLSKEKHDYILGEEFTKLANADTSIFGTMKTGLSKRFFADYPKSEFELYDYGGEKKYVNKAGKTMSDLLADFLNTDEGKHYRENKNTGGGASGSSSAGAGGGMSRQQFDKLPYAQQASYMKGGGVVHD